MANLTVTSTTAISTLTENASTINRTRAAICVTEALVTTENVSTVNRTRATICATEALTVTESAATVPDFVTGTATLAFSGISALTGAGTTDLLYHVDTFYATDSMLGVFDWTITDTIIAGDSTLAILTNSLEDAVLVTETITHDWIANLEDTFYAGNAIGPVIWDANLWPTPKERWREQIKVFLSEYVVGSLTATETLNTSRINSLEDSFTATEALTNQVEQTRTLTGTIRATESLTPGAFEQLITGNTIIVTGLFTDTVSPRQTYTETFYANEALVNNATLSTLNTDVVVATGTIELPGMVANQALHETLTAHEVLWASDFAALAWVLNIETTGLSTYDNFGFNSVTAYNGILYATSPEGVFVINGDKDQARRITSRVKTGMLDFGIETTKRISDVFVGYTGGRLSYEVETYDGPTEVYTYEMPERDSDAPRNNRVKPGRGLSSRYWRFGIENIDGADFQLHNQTAVVGVSKRRL